jgi:hypothetical protein
MTQPKREDAKMGRNLLESKRIIDRRKIVNEEEGGKESEHNFNCSHLSTIGREQNS